MDYGYPQILDADLLKEYIATGKQDKKSIEVSKHTIKQNDCVNVTIINISFSYRISIN